MKSKMRITGNRTVIGIICIVLALGITFGIAPLVNRFTDRKVEVVQVKQNVERGHLITEDDVELVKVGALNLSDRTVKNKKYVVGKYAATNLYAGQIMIADLVAEKSNSADDVLSALDGTKVAISVNIASFAQGLSNKLRNGDIVSVIVYDKETNQSHVPPELRYVKVITDHNRGFGGQRPENRRNTGDHGHTACLSRSGKAACLPEYHNDLAFLSCMPRG